MGSQQLNIGFLATFFNGLVAEHEHWDRPAMGLDSLVGQQVSYVVFHISPLFTYVRVRLHKETAPQPP